MVGLRRPGGGLLRWRRPTPGAQRLGRPISIGVEAFGRRLACADREGVFCVGVGRRLAWSALEGRFQSAWRPSADGWPAPTERCLLRRRRLTPGAQAPWKADFNRRGGLRPCVPNEFGLWGPSAGGRPAPTEGGLLRRRRPTPGAQAPWKADFNRRGGLRPCVPNEFGLWRPSAGGRPAPTEGIAFASAEADAWRGGCRMNSAWGGLRPMVGLRRPGGCLLRWRRPTPGAQAPWKADFNRRGGLRPMVGLRRPGGCLLRWRRPTPGAQRLGRPISIGVGAFGRWSACADREGVFCVGGGRRLARKRLGRPISIAVEAFGPAVGLRRPKGWSLRRRRPTPGVQRL
jgi:hypothetical protein